MIESEIVNDGIKKTLENIFSCEFMLKLYNESKTNILPKTRKNN